MEFQFFSTQNPITDNLFDNVYRLLKESLPQNEMRTYTEQKLLLKNDRYNIFVATDNERLVGFISVWDFNDFAYIEHFAVNANERGKGIGSQILSECKKLFKTLLILEVEPKGSTENAERRIGFYERNGFVFNDYEYNQPPLQKGFDLLPLKIMSYPIFLDKNSFARIKNKLYNEVYGIF